MGARKKQDRRNTPTTPEPVSTPESRSDEMLRQLAGVAEAYAQIDRVREMLASIESQLADGRERLHRGEALELSLHNTIWPQLWYVGFVPSNLRSTYTYQDWERDIEGVEGFTAVPMAGTTATYITLNLNSTALCFPAEIDEFFSRGHLDGQVIRLQRALELLWCLSHPELGVA